MSEENKEQEKLTPQQIVDNRKKVIQYYKDQISVVELQAKYEELLASIETSRATRMEMIIRQAQMAAGPEDPTPDTDNSNQKESHRDDVFSQEVAPQSEEKKERVLKKH